MKSSSMDGGIPAWVKERLFLPVERNELYDGVMEIARSVFNEQPPSRHDKIWFEPSLGLWANATPYASDKGAWSYKWVGGEEDLYEMNSIRYNLFSSLREHIFPKFGLKGCEVLFQEFWYLPGETFDWPPYIYIRNKKSGNYLRQTQTGKPFLTIRPKDPWKDGCVFRVLELGGSQVALMGSNGRVVSLVEYTGQSGGAFCLEGLPGLGSDSALKFAFNCHEAGSRNNFHFAQKHQNTSYFLSASKTLFNTGGSDFRGLNSTGSASDDTLMEVEEAVISRRISDIKYDSDKEISQLTPRALLTATVRNDSRTHDSKSTLNYSYTKSVVGSWTSSRAKAVSLKETLSFTATMPTIIKSTSEVGFTESEQHTWGETNTKTEQVSSSSEITIPPGYSGTVRVSVLSSKVSVGFTYKEEVRCLTGEVLTFEKRGVFRNVDGYHVEVTVDDLSSFIVRRRWWTKLRGCFA